MHVLHVHHSVMGYQSVSHYHDHCSLSLPFVDSGDRSDGF